MVEDRTVLPLHSRIRQHLDTPVDLWGDTPEDANERHGRAIALLVEAEKTLKAGEQPKDEPATSQEIADADPIPFGCEEHGYFHAGVRWRESLRQTKQANGDSCEHNHSEWVTVERCADCGTVYDNG